MTPPRTVRAAAAVAGLAALLAACTSTPQPIPGAATSTAPAGAPPREPAPQQVAGVPIPAGRVDSAVARVDDLAREALAAPGASRMAVAVVHDGRIALERGYAAEAPAGTAAPAPAAAPDEHTAFALGALSAPLAATVVATQLGEGRSWSTPVHTLLPQFALADPYATEHATLGDLFAGTLGLPPAAGSAAAQAGIDRQDLIGRLRTLPAGGFRAEAGPTDLGPTVAGEAVTAAAGTDFASLADNALLHRLGMGDTSFRHADFAARDDAAAPAPLLDGRVAPAPARAWADVVAPALGASSSAHDMAEWMRAVLAGGTDGGTAVIPAEALTAALSPQALVPGPASADARARAMGFGFAVDSSPAGRVVVSGPGTAPGPSAPDAALTLIPSAGVGIVVLTDALSTPTAPVTAAETVAAQFADLVQFGETQRDWASWFAGQATATPAPTPAAAPSPTPPAAPSPTAAAPPPLSSFDGVYSSAFFGDAVVRTSNDTTTLTVGPGRAAYRLTPRGGGAFTVAAADPAAAPAFAAEHPGATAVFDGDALTLSFLDQAGPFRR